MQAFRPFVFFNIVLRWIIRKLFSLHFYAICITYCDLGYSCMLTWNKISIIHMLTVCTVHQKFTFSLFILYFILYLKCLSKLARLDFCFTLDVWPTLSRTAMFFVFCFPLGTLGCKVKNHILPSLSTHVLPPTKKTHLFIHNLSASYYRT